MELSQELRYSNDHLWVREDRAGADVATLGLTHYAQDELGEIVYLGLPGAGTMLEQFAKLGEIESIKTVSELFAPIGGEVVEINQDAVDHPELVNREPYGDGWLIKLRPRDRSELDSLLSADAYAALIAESH